MPKNYYTMPGKISGIISAIRKMNPSKRKLRWIQLNQEKLSFLAKELDASVTPNSLTAAEIDSLISEARKAALR